MNARTFRIAMISLHSSPLGELGNRDTGGMSVYVREVARRLARRGHAVDIFTRIQHEKSSKVLQAFPRVRVVHVGAGPRTPLLQGGLHRHLAEFFHNLERFRKEEGIDYDLVHSHYYLSGQIGRWAQIDWGVPHLFMFHTLGALKNRVLGPEKESDSRIALEESIARECSMIVAATEREKRQLEEIFGLPPHKIAVVPCGVDLETFKPLDRLQARARLGFEPARPLVLYVGRFDPVKGVDRLLMAAHQLRKQVDFQLVLVGGGGGGAAEDRKLQSLCRQLALNDTVLFAGRKFHHELPAYYSAADVLVLPSHYETFGLVLLEALACGTPVVAAQVGAVQDMVQNGVNGWMVPDNSPESLAWGVQRVLNPEGFAQASAGRIRSTVEHYDWDLVVASIERKYTALIEKTFLSSGSMIGQTRCLWTRGCVHGESDSMPAGTGGRKG